MSTGPFFLNDNSGVHIVAHMYAERQKRAIAAINIDNGNTGPLGPVCLRATASLMSTSSLHADTVIVSAPDMDHVSALLPPDDTLAAKDDLQPPIFADALLILLCAKSPSAAQGLLGDMYELFLRDCAKRGLARAKLYYWGYTMLSLWPLLKRALGRAATWAAIISAVKRYFVS
jgi:hypothetical protein